MPVPWTLVPNLNPSILQVPHQLLIHSLLSQSSWGAEGGICKSGNFEHSPQLILVHLLLRLPKPCSNQESRITVLISISFCHPFLFSPSALWKTKIWKMALFISASFLNAPAQVSKANTVIAKSSKYIVRCNMFFLILCPSIHSFIHHMSITSYV